MGGRFVAEGAQDALKNTVWVPKHLVVPEPHDLVAPGFEPRRALSVSVDRESLPEWRAEKTPPTLTLPLKGGGNAVAP